MELKKMIEIMQHFENGGVIQRCNFGSHNYSDITTEGYLFNFCDYKYRIKEPKQEVIIETWLMQSTIDKEYRIFETSLVDTVVNFKKVKLIESYEVELWNF